jgi:hypothetical protein
MQIEVFKKGYAAKEWPTDGANDKELDEEGNQKHRVYVSGPNGDCGYYDVVKNNFKTFPKSKIEFGLVDAEQKIVSVIVDSGNTIYLGLLNSDDDAKDTKTPAKDNLVEAIKNIEDMDENIIFEINLGPSKEVKINGRNHWIKANISVKVEQPKDIEKLYHNVSDLAESMLKLEEQRLWDSKY